MKIYAVQMDIDWESPASNHARAARLIKSASPAPGSMVVLPEMFCSGFSMDSKRICQGKQSVTEEFLAKTAKAHQIFLVGGLPKSGGRGKYFNQSLAFSPEGKLLCRYSKMQPFALGGELAAYTPGEQPCFFEWEHAPVASFICYDLRFPELFRTAVLRGAKIFTVIASWPDIRLHHWVKLLQARAIENQAVVIGVNRIGKDPINAHSGSSLIVDHHGNVLADAGNKEGVISAEIDLDDLDQYRKRFPVLADIREEYRAKLG